MKTPASLGMAATVLMAACGHQHPGASVDQFAGNPRIDTLHSSIGCVVAAQWVDDSHYLLVWGREKIDHVSTDTIRRLPSGVLTYSASSLNYVFVEQSCGTACSNSYVLPFAPGAAEIQFEAPIVFDSNVEVVAHEGSDGMSIRLTRLSTGQSFDIVLPFQRGPNVDFAIDRLAMLDDKTVKLQWRDTLGQSRTDTLLAGW